MVGPLGAPKASGAHASQCACIDRGAEARVWSGPAFILEADLQNHRIATRLRWPRASPTGRLCLVWLVGVVP